ncbi:MAG: hypothetical protein JWQ20_4369 [Conexibacter sp.]|nr:hypothetical protein [Solirubrobacterales bacterium]MCW3005071.1 hypothetical protein [Conexibacter sp.]
MNPTKPVASVLAAVVLSVAATGCGVNTAEDGAPAKGSTTAVSPTTTDSTPATGATGPATTPHKALPRRPAGTVAVDVQSRGGITALASRNFTGARVAIAQTSEDRAYGDLCDGRVDVIETSNLPTAADARSCADNGLQLADAVQVASDAIVLATKNESDIGGDCITVQQARDIFRAGSPYSNWSQLGFGSYPLRTSGRQEGSDNFQFFGFQVLGLNAASLADVRPDYRVFDQDQRLREDVTNRHRIASANRRATVWAGDLRASTRPARQAAVDRAVRQADARVQKDIERVNDRNRRLNITVDGVALALGNRRRAEAAKRVARTRVNAAFDTRLRHRVESHRRALLGIADAPGVVGPFRFGYYELFEDKLRPLEIDFGMPETESGQPVRFGDLSAAQQRRVAPLLQQIRARNAGTQGGSSTGPVPADTTLAGLTSTQLPEKDKNGKTIFDLPNCVFPARTTVTSGAYPLARRTFMVTTKTALGRPEVVSYLRFSLENAQQFAESDQQRLVPITDQQRFDGLRSIGVANPTLPADPVAPTGPTTSTEGDTTTTTVGGTPTTTSPSTTTTTPGPGGSSSGIPGVSNRGG